MYIYNADQNFELEHKHHCLRKAPRPGAGNTMYHCPFTVSDNPEMPSRAQYVKRETCKLHRDKQLLHISISTRHGHLMSMFGLWLVTSEFQQTENLTLTASLTNS